MRFLVDCMLQDLGRWLRILGYDTLFCEGRDDNELLKDQGDRVLLTRDKELARRSERALYVEGNTIEEKLTFVFRKLGLKVLFPGRTRCPLCNALLRPTTREEVEKKAGHPVESPRYWVCPHCGKVYWEGSHWKRIRRVIDLLRSG